MKKYKLRYNTESRTDLDRWRLITDEGEEKVSGVIINDVLYTSKDFIESVNGFKYHLSCEGDCVVKDGIAYISTDSKKSSIKKHILKTISWRIVGTLDTMILGWLISGNPLTGLKIGAFEVITKMILYYAHERVWYKRSV